MTDATLLANVKRELDSTWKLLLPFVRDGRAYSQLRDRHDAAAMALEELIKRHGQVVAPVVEQPSLVAAPEFDRELSLKVDQLDKQIDQASAAGQFARVTALTARKQQIMRAAGL